MRRITDDTGKQWAVSDFRTGAGSARPGENVMHFLATHISLVFRTDEEQFFYSGGVPDDWEKASDDQLRSWLSASYRGGQGPRN